MTDWTNVSPLLAAAIFVVALSFVVGSLEMFRRWLRRGTRADKLNRAHLIAALLGAVFIGMLGAGAGSFLAIGHKTFVSLTLVIDGALGLALLLETMVKFHWTGTGNADEMRRIAAHDL